jgi:hypothetical protein
MLLGEPLTLLVRLENCSNTVQSSYETLAPEYGSLAIWIRAPGAAVEELYRPPVRRESRGAKLVELRPREIISALVPVYLDAKGWTLSRPGRYEFRAELRLPTGLITSKPIPVGITALDAKSKIAAERLMSDQAAYFLYLQGGDDRGRTTLESLTREFSGSPWADYASLALAIDSATTAPGQLERKPGACREVQAATQRVRDWAFALNGYRATVRCLRGVGDNAGASVAAQEAARRYPQARGIPEFRIE